ncbi:LytR family transcriptional regulator [Streptomyces antnestii]|uniref:LytR family transcriptional regulator n=1 Tax=Streptomyces antnestii TaxID=2494256 RepID=A0A3S2VAP3_9ACTN|nr:LCP family protein [Streptomyces sp. San01]RVU18549.1 LytR family transcriptional regulator [Streptomyces sp. San01]
MNDWPEGWGESQGGGDRGYGRGSASARPEGARAMPHVQRGQGGPGRSAPPRPGVPAQPSYGDGYGDQYDSGYNTGQVYGGGGGRRGGGYVPNDDDPADGYAPPRPRPNWGRRIRRTLVTLVVLLLGVSIGTYFWADSKLHRDVDLSKVIERPETGSGTNYLIVGTDSRQGMTAADKKRLHTGSAEGKRTDTMMILHTGSNGSTMISLPRDSNVTIPSYKGSASGKLYPNQGRQVKLNAAYAEDGPELLVRTVEYNTGLHIDHYAEIGFGGFAKIVDAVGGVDMDLKQGFKDKWSGADFKAGKQTLNGQQALAFVRTRHAFAASDLQRTKNQQAFLSALAHQVATPSTVMNPFKLYPTMGAGLDSLVVDKDMSLFNLGSMFWAMKGVTSGDGKSMNMPVSGSVGGNLLWDKAKVKQLVAELKNDDKVTVSGN